MTDNKTPVWVTIAVNIGGETRTFEADATTDANPFKVARGLMNGVKDDALSWLYEQGMNHGSGR